MAILWDVLKKPFPMTGDVLGHPERDKKKNKTEKSTHKVRFENELELSKPTRLNKVEVCFENDV